MKKLPLLAFFTSIALSSTGTAALFSISGNHRLGINWYHDLDASSFAGSKSFPKTEANSTSYIEHRLILRPDVLIDERFSIRSEISLINQNNFNDAVGSVHINNGGAGFGSNGTTDTITTDPKTNVTTVKRSPQAQAIQLRAAYLKWNSDIGIFRAGRMPKGWGLGLLYDEGTKSTDDAGTIVDRIGFEGALGSLVLNFGFEKYQEGDLHSDTDDDEVYEGSVKYENEGSGVGIGLLFGRHIRGYRSAAKLNELKESSNDVSFYAKKEWDTASIGGEIAGVAYDKEADVYGGLGQFRYNPGNWNIEADAAMSSTGGDHAFIVHPNYRPFLILFHQAQGRNVANPNASRFGRGVGYDPSYSPVPADAADPTVPPTDDAKTQLAEKGALLGRVGFFYSFSQKKYKVGLSGGYAKLMKANTNGTGLGYEADLHFDQRWYDNFHTAVTAGVFIPGNAFPSPTAKSFGFQLRSYLDF